MKLEEAPESYRNQMRRCVSDGLYGSGEGPVHVMDPAFPNAKFREYVLKHGKPPEFRLSTCKRFGGLCSSGHHECRKLRGADQ